MLQRLENFYLAILRFVVIAVAGVLLVAVVVLGFRATGALRSEPEPTKVVPAVTHVDLKQAVLNSSSESSGGSDTAGNAAGDPNQMLYDRVGNSIKHFFDKHFAGQYNVEPAGLANFVKGRADNYEEADIRSAYAKSLAENIDKMLADKDVIAYAQSNEPGPTVDRVVNSFTEAFDREIASANAKNEEQHAAYLVGKAEAQQSLYMAIGAFAIFLSIVFLSIIIRIERNLRPDARAAA